MAEPVLVIALTLDQVHAQMWNELMCELRMEGAALGEHAITSLWVTVQLQRAVAKLK